MSYYLAVIGTTDVPLFELEFGSFRSGGDGRAKFPQDMQDLNPFIVHAALDVVEEVQWSTDQLYLKVVDGFYGRFISAYVTPGNVKLLLVHELKADEAIRQFFSEVADLYVRTLLSPFYSLNDPIRNVTFEAKVMASAKKYL